MTNYKQLRFTTLGSEVNSISELLESEEVLSISLLDAEDQPIYEPDPNTLPIWDKTIVTALFSEDKDLTSLIQTLKLEQYSIEKIEDQAWERACMDQFHPMRFGKKLWICPSWHKIAEPDAVIVMLDPGLAFGTGTHATTKLCLEWLASENIKNKTIIDYGSGSGILGIAALKLGASKVYAVDIDLQAREATEENAERNNVSLKAYSPAEFSPLKADILIANILANPLIELAPLFLSYLKLNSQIVLSGILPDQIISVQKAYESLIEFNPPFIEEGWVRLTGKVAL
jgi:ribosomal protein L11 methyltransferase